MNYLFLYVFCLTASLYLQNAQSFIQAILNHSNEQTNYQRIMQRIFNQCFNEMVGTQVAIGDWTNEDALLLSKKSTNSKPLYLFDAKKSSLYNYKKFGTYSKLNETIVETKLYSASNVTIAVSKEDTLMKLLYDLKNSVWWNREAHFLIVNKNYGIGCKVARKFLEVFWNFDILSVIYFCFENANTVHAYTFNPYDRFGSDFWSIAWTSSAANNYWTMLEHSFNESFILHNGTLICNDLHLDKTKNLNQLNIKIGGRQSQRLFQPGPILREMTDDLNMFRVMFKIMNATCTLKRFPELGSNEKSGPTGFLKEIKAGKLKAATNLLMLQDYWKHQTYPREFNSFSLITPKISNIYNLASLTSQEWPIFTTVCILSLIVIKYVFRRSNSWTLLEFVRILTGGSFSDEALHPLNNFLLINTIFAVATFNLCLQTYFTTTKMSPNTARQINTVDELIDSGMILAGSAEFMSFMYKKQILETYEIANQPFTCLDEIAAGIKKACAIYTLSMKIEDFTAFSYESKEPMVIRPSSYCISSDWSLRSKLDELLSRLAESGIYRITLATYPLTRKWTKSHPQAQSMTLTELSLCFKLLFGGYCLAVLAFFVELIFFQASSFFRSKKDSIHI